MLDLVNSKRTLEIWGDPFFFLLASWLVVLRLFLEM